MPHSLVSVNKSHPALEHQNILCARMLSSGSHGTGQILHMCHWVFPGLHRIPSMGLWMDVIVLPFGCIASLWHQTNRSPVSAGEVNAVKQWQDHMTDTWKTFQPAFPPRLAGHTEGTAPNPCLSEWMFNQGVISETPPLELCSLMALLNKRSKNRWEVRDDLLRCSSDFDLNYLFVFTSSTNSPH